MDELAQAGTADGRPAGDGPPDLRPYIDAYVEGLKASGALRDPALERAFRRVPRHLFVERFFVSQETQDGHPEQRFTPVEHDPQRPLPEHLETIYSEAALVTRLADNLGTSSSSQPGLMAEMLHLLELQPGTRVLEIGAGTGYNAALLAELVGDPACVTTLDIQEDVAAQARRALARAGYPGVTVLCRDGSLGAPEGAPFDRIVATVGCPDLSPRWVEQLAPSGFLLLPLRHAGANPLVRLWPDSGPAGPAGAGGASSRGPEAPAGDAGAGGDGTRGPVVAGRVVGMSGFMAIQGALRDEAYYDFSQPAPDPGHVQRPLWPELAPGGGAGGPNGPAKARRDFWFYLGLRDPRARLFRWLSSFGLDDKPTGKVARVEGDRVEGDPALLDHLDAFYREWRELGAPGMSRYRLRFVPHGEGAPAPRASESAVGRWVLAGRHYRHEFTLPGPL